MYEWTSYSKTALVPEAVERIATRAVEMAERAGRTTHQAAVASPLTAAIFQALYDHAIVEEMKKDPSWKARG